MLESQRPHLESLKRLRDNIELKLDWEFSKGPSNSIELSKLISSYLNVIEKIDQYESVLH